MIQPLLLVSALLLSMVVLFALNRLIRHNLDIQGPKAPSWLLGHQSLIVNQEDVGDLDFNWVQNYGKVLRIGDCFGEEALMIADPKAIRFIMQTAGYHARKTIQNRTFLRLVSGRGILWVDDADHQRHRKIMNPAFAPPQLRALLPVFHRVSALLTEKWKDVIVQSTSKTQVIMVNDWLSKATLDAIGEAGFELDLGTLQSRETELTRVYHNLFSDTQHKVDDGFILFQALWTYLPFITDYLEYLPVKTFKRIKDYIHVSCRVAESIIKEKRDDCLRGDKNGKDIMSIFIRANAAEKVKGQLDDVELVSQMTTLLLSGHETTSSTMTWLLYEVARHPEYQGKMREEIRAARARVVDRGESDFTTADFDSMRYLNAFIKETLRFHPIVYNLPRIIDRDDVLPLSEPLTTSSGKVITELPVRDGQKFVVSICAYNRLPEVWGADADTFNISRFLNESKVEPNASVGVYSNLMTFSTGVRSCIGWRFALLELQALTATLVEHFVFAPAPGVQIRRAPAQIMIPLIKGKENKGTQMPLLVSIVE